MATGNSRRDVELALRVSTDGGDKVGELAGDLRDLAGEGQSLGAALSGGAAGADLLTGELARLAAVTKEQRAAEAAAAAEVAQAKRNLDEQRDALQRLRVQYSATGGDAAKYKADVTTLSLAILDSKAALREKRDALAAASTAAKMAAAAEVQVTTELHKAGDASRSAAHDLAALPAAGMSWVEFLKGRMGPAMREFSGNHSAAIKKLSADYAEYKRTGQASMQAVAQSSVAAGAEVSDVLRRVGGLLATTFSAQQFVQAIASYEALQRSFEQIFGSAARAGEELGYIKETANRLGVENLTLAKSYISLSAATKGTTLEGEQTRAVFEAIVRSMSTLGKSTAETERALVAVQQIASKGTASMEELRQQLGEALPGALQAAAKGAGITTEELVAMVSSGQVLASDILPALAKGLTDLYGKAPPPDNIISNWARLKNTLIETAVAVGEGGASSGLAKGLSGAAIAVQGASAEVDILGTALGEMAAAVVTGNYELGTGEALTNKYADALRKSAETAGFAEKAQAGLTAAQQQGNQTAQESFRAVELAAQRRAQEGESLLAIKARYGELLKQQSQYIEQVDREVKATATQGDALVRLVAMYGTEAERLQASTQAAEANFEAMQRLARSREVEAIAAQALALRLEQEAIKRNDTSEATRKDIQEANKSAAAKNTEATQAKASAEAKRIEAEAARTAAAAYQDNSARVWELRGAVEQANIELARLIELEKQGKATADQVADARVRAAGAVRLYRDALSDATAAAERRIAAETQAATQAQATIGLEMERLKAAREVADANGDAAKATELNRQASLLQVQAYQQEAESARLVANAIREAADRKEQELRATGGLTAARQQEIAAARASADLKEIEAERADILARKTRELANSEQTRTDALERSIAAQEKAIELAERRQKLEERKRTSYNTAGEAVNMGGATLMSIIETLRGYGLNDKRAQEVARQFTDSRGDVPYFNNPGQRLYGADTLSMAIQKAASAALYGGGNTSPPTEQGSARTVNISIGGRSTPINVASQADSDNLVSALRALESAASRAT